MISIVIPTFKGAGILSKQLPEFIQFLNASEIVAEIVVVDDGSDDNGQTGTVAKELQCKFIQLVKNTGKGAAVREGIKHCSGEICFFTDVDIPFQFDAFLHFIQSLKEGNNDIVVGDRTLPGSSYYTKIGVTRKLGSDLFSKIVSKLFTDGLHDTQCGMKAFKQSVAMDLFSVARINGFAFDVELISIAVKRAYKIDRLPVQFRCNDSKTVQVIRHGLGMLKDIIRVAMFHKLGYYHKKE
jgi:dolichyl-phosphate beta-glucosyltransferase